MRQGNGEDRGSGDGMGRSPFMRRGSTNVILSSDGIPSSLLQSTQKRVYRDDDLSKYVSLVKKIPKGDSQNKDKHPLPPSPQREGESDLHRSISNIDQDYMDIEEGNLLYLHYSFLSSALTYPIQVLVYEDWYELIGKKISRISQASYSLQFLMHVLFRV